MERDANGIPELYETETDFSIMVDSQGFLTARAVNITRKNGKFTFDPVDRLGPGFFRMRMTGNNHPVCLPPAPFGINEQILRVSSP